ncbi:hypothetical protein NM688_g1247 [Phlebia brevispora]|uniref:Uncharacterized protein n=1 Tax=Phlebia brevispora TaxID=194682 RepID=A0ACC1TBW6_9APHY|nr:hypothetical protein NM688_g1247 [Phlebia brevispora]
MRLTPGDRYLLHHTCYMPPTAAGAEKDALYLREQQPGRGIERVRCFEGVDEVGMQETGDSQPPSEGD